MLVRKTDLDKAITTLELSLLGKVIKQINVGHAPASYLEPQGFLGMRGIRGVVGESIWCGGKAWHKRHNDNSKDPQNSTWPLLSTTVTAMRLCVLWIISSSLLMMREKDKLDLTRL